VDKAAITGTLTDPSGATVSGAKITVAYPATGLSRSVDINGSGVFLIVGLMLARLEGAVNRISRFTADASHELRSPISFIRTVSEYALRNPNVDADSNQAFQEILAESVETARLLEDMLALARADAGCVDMSFEALNPAELIKDVCDKIRPLANAKQQVLVVECDSSPTWIKGDRSSLRRLLWTLLDNAIKGTPPRGLIDVALHKFGSEARITARDTRIGIPEAMLRRIFERFFRVDPSRSEVDGTGLGLANRRIAPLLDVRSLDFRLRPRSSPLQEANKIGQFLRGESSGGWRMLPRLALFHRRDLACLQIAKDRRSLAQVPDIDLIPLFCLLQTWKIPFGRLHVLHVRCYGHFDRHDQRARPNRRRQLTQVRPDCGPNTSYRVARPAGGSFRRLQEDLPSPLGLRRDGSVTRPCAHLQAHKRQQRQADRSFHSALHSNHVSHTAICGPMEAVVNRGPSLRLRMRVA